MTNAAPPIDTQRGRVPAGAGRHTRTDRVAAAGAAALILLHAVLAWLGRAPGIATRQDDAIYVILAHALRTGRYHDLFRIDAPPHSLYPPGYPALLAAWGLPGGDGHDWLVLFSILCSAATLALLFLAFRRIGTAVLALVALLPLAVNPWLLEYAGSVASEAPYAFLATLALFLLMHERRGARRIGAACVVAAVAALTRSVGIALIAAVLLHLLAERRWKWALVFGVGSLIVVGGWFVWVALGPEQFVGRSYVADALARPGDRPLVEILRRRSMYRPVAYLGRWLPATLEFPALPNTPIDNIAAVAIIAIGGAAGGLLFLRRWRPAALYVPIYGAILLVWTWGAGRFLVPLLGLIAGMMLIGVARVGDRLRPGAGVWSAAAVAALLAWGGATDAFARVAERRGCASPDDLPAPACLKRDQVSYFDAIRYIREQLPPDAVIVSMKPEPIYLYTGRRTVWGRTLLAEPEHALERMREMGAGYVLLGSLQAAEPRRMPALLEGFCRELAVASFFPPRTYLFRVRAAREGGREEGCRALADFRAANADRDFENDP